MSEKHMIIKSPLIRCWCGWHGLIWGLLESGACPACGWSDQIEEEGIDFETTLTPLKIDNPTPAGCRQKGTKIMCKISLR